jgi:probable HAF family extracellular repeat protein/parallel beta-helix repeat protein
MKSKKMAVLAALVLFFGFVSTSFAATASFQGLGDLPGGDFSSIARGVSADGSVVVGQSSSLSSGPVYLEAFRWTLTGGMQGLGDLSGGSFKSGASAVSDDGSVVVGRGNSDSGWKVVRWENGIITSLDFGGYAHDVSANGAVVVGYTRTPSVDSEAFRWTEAGGMQVLGMLDGFSNSSALAVSSDGLVVVGASSGVGLLEAFRWTLTGGMQGLGDLPGGSECRSIARGVSADGSIVVGQGRSELGTEAFRWTLTGGMQGLGDLPGDDFYSNALAVSSDGLVVVGESRSEPYTDEAFIWDATNGIRNLRDLLVNDYGLDLTGWTLAAATGISDDGLTIVGYGWNSTGDLEAWIAKLPEPMVYYVDSDATGGDDGSSWGDAFNDLQDALAAAASEDEIRVAQGIYKPDMGGGNAPGDHEATFQLKNGVAIKGGYAGFGEPDPNAWDIEVYETVLSGDIGWVDNPWDNSYHVVTGSWADSTAVLDGFTITAGNANGWPENPLKRGGGMYNNLGSPTVTNCTFSGNTASQLGGGMYNDEDSSPMVTNCTFSGNSAHSEGGGMYNGENSSPTLTNCTFSGNSASESGGGMSNQRSSPTVTNCTFRANRAEWGSGGMLNIASNPTVTNCTFAGNSTGRDGGGMLNYWESSPTITNCTFIGNSAGWEGGGMYNYWECSPTITNCTFSGNSAGWDGGAMYNMDSSPTLANCILWGNIAPSGPQIYNDVGGSATVSYSDVQGGWPGEGNIDADPCFVEPEHFGPISHWKFDEGGGTTAYDSAGDNDGTIYGAQWITGQIDGALSFDGVEDYVRTANNVFTNAQLASGATLSAWFNTGSTAYGYIADNEGYLTLVVNHIYAASPNKLCGIVDGGHHRFFSSSDVTDNLWHHAAIVWDGTDTAILYLDGVNVSSGFSGPPTPDSKNRPFTIGAHSTIAAYFNGLIDEVAIYDGALSAEEIEQLYQIGVTGPGDYHLKSDSPCIDAGDPNYVAEPNKTDLDGRPRVIGGRIDMGAYEFNHIPVADAGEDQIVECACNTQQGTKVTLDGTGSYDPDEDNVILVAEGAAKRVLVPTGPISDAWRGGQAFDDSGWNDGMPIIAGKTGGVGYERGSGYEDYITYDVEEEMRGNNTTCYIRIPFTVDANDLASFNYMTLKMRCDDGFIAYLNGDKVRSKNFGGIPVWNSQAHGITESSEFEYFPVSEYLYALQPGDNILAIHGLNISMSSSDFLISTELIASETEPGPPIVLEYTWTGPFVETDVNGPTPTVTLDSGCPGEYVITLVVNDGIDDSEPNDVVITVVDTTPPVITCPPDVTLECPADTSVEANGSATASDTCGSATITHSDQWQPDCGNTGMLMRTWTATDEYDNSSTCVQTITVIDTTPPDFALSVSPSILWPPNHKMELITPSWTVSDECDATPDVSLVSIVANEGDDIIGDGHTTDDIQIGDDGSIYLRSERSGTGNDRVYTITYQAVDDCGNATVGSATVNIPHDFKVLARIAARWLWTGPAGRIQEDLNGDGTVNFTDFAKFAENWIK